MVERKDFLALAFSIAIACVAAAAIYVLFPPALPESAATAVPLLPIAAQPVRQPASPTPVSLPIAGSEVRLATARAEYQRPPPFTYTLILPRLEGGTPGSVEPFNRAVEARAIAELDEFQSHSTDDGLAAGGEFRIDYTVPYASDRLVSVRLDVDVYVVDSPHPGAWSTALNYDLAAGRVLALADLFRPEVDYLGVLSRYCLDDLQRQGVLSWEDGALPRAENYEPHWNFASEGLVIDFDTYSVAPGAAGPQQVVVPYEVLRDVATVEGPLTWLTP